jgi:hypothetical protein
MVVARTDFVEPDLLVVVAAVVVVTAVLTASITAIVMRRRRPRMSVVERIPIVRTVAIKSAAGTGTMDAFPASSLADEPLAPIAPTPPPPKPIPPKLVAAKRIAEAAPPPMPASSSTAIPRAAKGTANIMDAASARENARSPKSPMEITPTTAPIDVPALRAPSPAAVARPANPKALSVDTVPLLAVPLVVPRRRPLSTPPAALPVRPPSASEVIEVWDADEYTYPEELAMPERPHSESDVAEEAPTRLLLIDRKRMATAS